MDVRIGISESNQVVEVDMADDTDNEDQPSPGKPRVRWDSSQLQVSYANVCSITSSRDEFVFSYGLNQTLRKMETCGKPVAAAINGAT